MNTGYQPLDQDDQQLFQQHLKGISKAVHEAFPSLPAGFQLKPVTIQKTNACATIYNIKIALPDGQFAKVTFSIGGLPAPRGPGQKEPEQHYRVDPSSSATDDD